MEPALPHFDFQRDGFDLKDHFISGQLLSALRTEAFAARQAGKFKSAGVGQGGKHRVDPSVRGDEILWIDPKAGPGQNEISSILENFLKELNQKYFLGLKSFEAHLAIYPSGSFYSRHLDRFTTDSKRTVSAVLYLNEEWRIENGGILRIYPMSEALGTYLDVEPKPSRFVYFLSDEIEHEVLVTKTERLSLACWFKR